MSEIVIGVFPESREAEEVVPMLANRGYHSDDIDVIGGRGATLSGSGSDLVDKLSRLGVADEDQKESFLNVISHGGTVIATRTPDERKAEQVDELMRDHGATQCVHAPDTGWNPAA
jgi:hypothetical protein